MKRIDAKPDTGQLFGVTALTVFLAIPIMSSLLFLSGVMFWPEDTPSLGLLLFFGPSAVVIWPLSLLLAASLFAACGSYLLKREGTLGHFHLFEWLVVGAAIGATVAVGMLLEMEVRNDLGVPMFSLTDLWLVAPGAGTGLICALFWRWLIARFVNRAVDGGKGD